MRTSLLPIALRRVSFLRVGVQKPTSTSTQHQLANCCSDRKLKPEIPSQRGFARFCQGCSAESSGTAGSSFTEQRYTANIIDASVEGGSFSEYRLLDEVKESLIGDAEQLLGHIEATHTQRPGAGPFELSIVVSDDTYIAELNKEYREKRGPTDVLSFAAESPPGYPMQLLGDIVISAETAQRQANEQGHTLRDECRVLLVHGLLHLLGHDHEKGAKDSEEMESKERAVLAALGWKGKGLIAASGSEAIDVHCGERVEPLESTSQPPPQHRKDGARSALKNRTSDIKLLALDMDGTLLDSQSKVLPSSVEALRAALATGVRVCLATGKARPAAMAAMAKVGLAGDGLVISSNGPGLFLQGLAVHGGNGRLLEGPDMPWPVVQEAFRYAQDRNIPLAAFLGDECATLQMHPELEELHYRYYEPLCRILPDIDALAAGTPVKKLLFMTSADAIAEQHAPYWAAAVKGQGAETTMAVPNMLEVVPKGINKWVGMQLLLQNLGLSADSLMSCGDGSNDLQLVANSGLGVAMGNAVTAVKEAAKVVVGSNDDGGIAEAIERYVL